MNCMEPFDDVCMHPLCTMTVRKRRIFDFDSQSDDSQSYGYGGGGGGACPQINAALHRDSRMGAVGHEDEETWAPFPPNITTVVQQRRDPQGGPVTSTPVRQGRSPTSPRSPVLGYGLAVRTSSLFSMSGTPTSATAYSSAGSTLAVSSAAPTNVSHTASSPDSGDVMPASQQSRAKGGRLPGVDKEGSDTINVIILQAILAENRMVRSFRCSGASEQWISGTQTEPCGVSPVPWLVSLQRHSLPLQ
jgi:hypothetical protein